VKHLYTIICDDVRREDNLKLIVIGMYLGTISVSQLPTIMPTLTVMSVFESERDENMSFTVTIQSLESGKTVLKAQGFANVRPGPGIIPVKFGPVRFDQAGAYSIVTEIQGHSEVLVTNFQVVLTPQIGNMPFPRPN
jgi:hypothetical protein